MIRHAVNFTLAMSSALLLCSEAVQAQEISRVLCVVDAATNAAIPFARVRVAGRTLPASNEAERRAGASWCVVIPANIRGTVDITRIGYAPASFAATSTAFTAASSAATSAATSAASTAASAGVSTGASAAATSAPSPDTIVVRLIPLAAALPASVTVAAQASSVGSRNAVTMSTDSARAMGVASTGALVALLPYTFPRSARGEVTLSLRGARREQVAVTLDGVPLTDPATGLADLADVPLVALGAVTVAPGSDPLSAGPGAAGGVLALQSGTGTIGSLRFGAFGDIASEAAWSHTSGDFRVRIGGAHRSARNDFPFVNTSSTTGTALDERRTNNDVSRSNALLQLQTSRAQLTLLASRAQLGLVGPVNVRDNDEDRSTTMRLFARGTAQAGRTMMSASARSFALDYRDPSRPQFNTDSRAFVGDMDVRRTLGGMLVHLGAGADRLRTSTDVTQDRARGFVSAVHARRMIGLDVTGGVRADAIGGSGVLPSFSLAAVRRNARVEVGARVAQAVRVPTLYDLYFSSPQRITVRALRPERVVFDGEAHARWSTPDRTGVRLSLEAALVQRITRNAIVWFPGNFGWSPANVGTESLRGIEARATVENGPLDVSVWGTAYDPELTSGSLRIPTPYVPQFAGGAITRLQLSALQLSAANRWLGARPFTAGPRDPAFTLPAVMLLDLAVSTRRSIARSDVLVAATLDNATNRAWQSVRGFPAPGRAWSVAITIRP